MKKQLPSITDNSCKSYSELIRPIGKFLTSSIHAEHLAGLERGTRAAGRQFLIRLTHAASAGRSKRNDSLACEVIAFQEGINDRGCHIPPNGEANVDRVIVSYVVTESLNLRAGGHVTPLAEKYATSFLLIENTSQNLLVIL